MNCVKINLLMTCVGGDTVRSTIAQLKQTSKFDLFIIGVDGQSEVHDSDRVIDRYFQVPMGDSPDYIQSLLAVIKKNNVDFVLPGSDEEALSISQKIDLIEQAGAKGIVSEKEVLDIISNKLSTYLILGKNNVALPEYSVVYDKKTFFEILKSYAYPAKTVVSKPVAGRGGRGLIIWKGQEEQLPDWLGSGKREKIISSLEDGTRIGYEDYSKGIMVMPQLGMPVYDVDVLANKGDVKKILVRKRVNPAGIPFMGCEIVHDTEIISYCSHIARALKLNSLHDIDLMTNYRGEPQVLEVNPRPSGSIVAAIEYGMNFIDDAIDLLLNNKRNS